MTNQFTLRCGDSARTRLDVVCAGCGRLSIPYASIGFGVAVLGTTALFYAFYGAWRLPLAILLATGQIAYLAVLLRRTPVQFIMALAISLATMSVVAGTLLAGNKSVATGLVLGGAGLSCLALAVAFVVGVRDSGAIEDVQDGSWAIVVALGVGIAFAILHGIFIIAAAGLGPLPKPLGMIAEWVAAVHRLRLALGGGVAVLVLFASSIRAFKTRYRLVNRGWKEPNIDSDDTSAIAGWRAAIEVAAATIANIYGAFLVFLHLAALLVSVIVGEAYRLVVDSLRRLGVVVVRIVRVLLMHLCAGMLTICLFAISTAVEGIWTENTLWSAGLLEYWLLAGLASFFFVAALVALGALAFRDWTPVAAAPGGPRVAMRFWLGLTDDLPMHVSSIVLSALTIAFYTLLSTWVAFALIGPSWYFVGEYVTWHFVGERVVDSQAGHAWGIGFASATMAILLVGLAVRALPESNRISFPFTRTGGS